MATQPTTTMPAWRKVLSATGHELPAGFVRYGRQLKGTTKQVTVFFLPDATTPAEKALVATLAKATPPQVGPFVVHEHTTGITASLPNWRQAYVWASTLRSPAIAPCQAAMLKEDGVAALTAMVPALTVRAKPATAATTTDQEQATAQAPAAKPAAKPAASTAKSKPAKSKPARAA